MKTLIMGDVHLRHKKVQMIIDHAKCNNVLYLGDFWDQFGDTPIKNMETAIWVRNRMDDHPEDIWVWGNHDISYAHSSRYTMCSGHTEHKRQVITGILDNDHWDRFKFCHWLQPDNWLCTHAGLHPRYVKKNKNNIRMFLDEEEKKAKQALYNKTHHWFWNAGHARGGFYDDGGVVWCDFREEFEPIPGLNQIFGHTCMNHVHPHDPPAIGEMHTKDSKNYNLDVCNLFYGIWDGKNLEIKSSIAEIPNFE